MAKKRGVILRRLWLLAIIFIIAISVVITGCEGSDQSEEPTVTEDTGEENDNESEESEGSEEEFIGIGEEVETDKIKVVITDMEKPEGDEFSKPDEGNEFVIFNLSIENVSDEDMTISSVLLFNAYVDDTSINEDFLAHTAADKSTIDGTIAPGKKLNGSLGYQVPEDWEKIEIHFEPDVFEGEKIVFEVVNE